MTRSGAVPAAAAPAPGALRPGPHARRRVLLALAGLAAGARTLRAEPATSGLDALLTQAAEVHDLHAVLVAQGGSLRFEHYRRSRDRPIGDRFASEVRFGPEVLHDLRSISKSVIALLVGQAIGRGEIDPERPVLDHFPTLENLRRDGREAIRVTHLLDMSAGLAWNEAPTTYGTAANDEWRLWRDGEPARYILDRPLVAVPGTLWNYNGGLTALLGAILEQRSGRRFVDLARSDLFEPLGITDWEWRAGAHGKPLAYAGLRMRPRDLLRLGQLLLAGGSWQGRSVLPAAWVAELQQRRITVGRGPLAYARQWWQGTVQRDGRALPFTAGLGNGGQRLYLVPGIDLAVVFTAGAYNQEGIGAAEVALFRQIVAAV